MSALHYYYIQEEIQISPAKAYFPPYRSLSTPQSTQYSSHVRILSATQNSLLTAARIDGGRMLRTVARVLRLT